MKIIIIGLFALLNIGCTPSLRHEKTFLSKYESEDFSQFNGVNIFIRSLDSKRNPIIMVDAPHLVNDTLRVGIYVVTFSRESHQVIDDGWTLTNNPVDADTLQLQQLAAKFIDYKIPRLDVDTIGNVFVYLKDVETLALAKFADEEEKSKDSHNWIPIQGDWYRVE